MLLHTFHNFITFLLIFVLVVDSVQSENTEYGTTDTEVENQNNNQTCPAKVEGYVVKMMDKHFNHVRNSSIVATFQIVRA